MAERGQVRAGKEQAKRKASPYKRGHHPNSRCNLQPFQAGDDPRRWRGGARTRDRQRELRFLAPVQALRSDLLSDEAREALLEKVVREVHSLQTGVHCQGTGSPERS
jgi:hypothetical protein